MEEVALAADERLVVVLLRRRDSCIFRSYTLRVREGDASSLSDRCKSRSLF